MASPEALTGTLEEGQVRAMFDRIARVYDLMNSVMTAGLHHRWRERAADLAALEPAAAHSTWPLARATWRSSWHGASGPAARSSARTSPRRCWTGRARSPPRSRWEWANALELPYPDDSFDAATVGFGARNFSDLDRGLRRDGARGAAGRPRRRAGDHGAAAAAARRRSSRSGSTASCRRWGGSRATPTPTRTCPARSSASPRPSSWARRLADAGLTDIRWILTAGGIIAMHSGTVR